jgi:hypothetical protein
MAPHDDFRRSPGHGRNLIGEHLERRAFRKRSGGGLPTDTPAEEKDSKAWEDQTA